MGHSEEARGIISALGQEWLLDGFDGSDSASEEAFYAQIVHLNGQYPGGLAQYVANAKRLLEESRDGVNPFEHCTPEVPSGLALEYGTEEFLRYEAAGLQEIPHACFVLVAGGLGERLGYNGIKLELPVEVTTSTCYLSFYLDCLRGLQVASGAAAPPPLAIMTSGDTHDMTVALLEGNGYFGYPQERVVLMKQEKVPSISDNTGRFVKSDKYTLETKPHGHGDVHQLLHSTGIAAKWVSEGKKWVMFMQDTNAMVFNTCTGALGLSKERSLQMNSICIARKAQEAIGGIAKLTKKDGSAPPLTISVEYNQLGPLLKDFNGEGDIPDATGFSPYPGNINTLLFSLPEYAGQLEKTKGLIAEFVNPKYADDTKTVFKKPTRLECMMQDYPKTLPESAPVGFTTFDRLIAFSAVKNNTTDAAVKAASGLDAQCAASGESDFYAMQCKRLSLCGVTFDDPCPEVEYNKIPIRWWPRVVLHPGFAPTLAALQGKVKPTGSGVHITARSSLVVEGEDVVIHSLRLDGALHIKVAPGASLVINSLEVSNEGWAFDPVASEGSTSVPESLLIRGYTLLKKETRELFVTTGNTVIG
eukprot:TRINITY_DN20592_c0_g1_i1.p1 TRINITY_DN20592_c0_g1~~TRINITY_DN20592_c0_g1_i1.p1  ORF type:complete len:588 (+),score=203.93 TRINITY_DN20592_c0_g1_i1:47-1810(+)